MDGATQAGARRDRLSHAKQALLRRRLRHSAALLEKDGEGAPVAVPQIVPDPDHRYEAFPLTDIQAAYWLGRGGDFDLGNVACHVYFEFENEELDLERLNDAWCRLVDRHDMLRAVFRPDGTQRILRDVPAYEIEVADLREAGEGEREARLQALRDAMSHRVMDPQCWPLFDLRVSRLPAARQRIHIGFDLLVGDYWSFQILMREMLQLYLNPEAKLSPLALSFRDYVLAMDDRKRGAEYATSLAYWRSRAASLPGGPQLPLAIDPAALAEPRFTHRKWAVPKPVWRRLQSRARRSGITPSGAMMAAFAAVLAEWSATRRFTLNVTLFDRAPVHPQVNDVVGDFTSVNLLEVDARHPESFTAFAKRTQEQLWRDLNHSHVGGVEVMRECVRAGTQAIGAVVPVVFTAALAGGGDVPPAAMEAAGGMAGDMVYSVSQTPQVWLNNQVYGEAGSVAFNWEVIEELFAPGVLDSMFAMYCELLERLGDADGAAWDAATAGASAMDREAAGSCARGRSIGARVLRGSRDGSGVPRNRLERELVSIWCELLEVTGVGLTDDFYLLGGNSLLAARMLARAGNECGGSAGLREFLAEPTIEHLARLLRRPERTAPRSEAR